MKRGVKKRSTPRSKTRRRKATSIAAIGVDSNYDAVTKPVYAYRETHVYPYLQKKGFHVAKFQGSMARRHYVAPAVEKPKVDYLTGVGHGLSQLYYGDHYDVVFQTGRFAPAEAEGKIVHFLSCRTARDLGPDFVKNGAKAYFGYDADWIFWFADQDAFFECDSEIDRAFADGLTAAGVDKRVRSLYTKRIADSAAAGKLDEAATLEFDRDHLRSPASGKDWGSGSVKLR